MRKLVSIIALIAFMGIGYNANAIERSNNNIEISKFVDDVKEKCPVCGKEECKGECKDVKAKKACCTKHKATTPCCTKTKAVKKSCCTKSKATTPCCTKNKTPKKKSCCGK